MNRGRTGGRPTESLRSQQFANFVEIVVRQGIVAALEPLPAVDPRRVVRAGGRAERNLEEAERLAGSLGGNAVRLTAGVDLLDMPQHSHLFSRIVVGSLMADPAHGEL